MIPIPQNPAVRIGLGVLLLLAGVIALHLAESVILPLLVAMLLATVLWPAAQWLRETLKIRWGLACITVVVGLVLASLLVTMILSASVARVVTQLSDQKEVLKIYNDFRVRLQNASPGDLDTNLFPENPENLSQIGILNYISAAGPYLAAQGANYAKNWSWQLGVTLFVTLFVLMEGKILARRAVAIIGPSDEVQSAAAHVLAEVANQVRTYLVWRTIINLGLGIVVWFIFWCFGLKQALTWAIVLVILNYIPYLGPILACLPPFLDAFIFNGPVAALGVLIFYWAAVILEGHLVVPLLMGRNMDLNATTVMLACLFWELVWGMTGMFLAMPIMAAIKAILFSVPEWRPWAVLMSAVESDEVKLGPALEPPPEPPPAGNPVLAPVGGGSPNGKPGTPHADAKEVEGGSRSS